MENANFYTEELKELVSRYIDEKHKQNPDNSYIESNFSEEIEDEEAQILEELNIDDEDMDEDDLIYSEFVQRLTDDEIGNCLIGIMLEDLYLTFQIDDITYFKGQKEFIKMMEAHIDIDEILDFLEEKGTYLEDIIDFFYDSERIDTTKWEEYSFNSDIEKIKEVQKYYNVLYQVDQKYLSKTYKELAFVVDDELAPQFIKDTKINIEMANQPYSIDCFLTDYIAGSVIFAMEQVRERDNLDFDTNPNTFYKLFNSNDPFIKKCYDKYFNEYTNIKEYDFNTIKNSQIEMFFNKYLRETALYMDIDDYDVVDKVILSTFTPNKEYPNIKKLHNELFQFQENIGTRVIERFYRCEIYNLENKASDFESLKICGYRNAHDSYSLQTLEEIEKEYNKILHK